jgi:two-component system LytT family response regulator
VHLSNGEQLLISKSLSKFSGELNQNRFVRVNQSYLINIRFIKSIDKRKKCIELQSEYLIKFTTTIKELLSAIGQDYAHS